jgi:uncharacterized protein
MKDELRAGGDGTTHYSTRRTVRRLAALTVLTLAAPMTVSLASAWGVTAAATTVSSRAAARTASPTGGAKVVARNVSASPTAANGSGVNMNALVASAMSQIGRTTLYDPSYVTLAYPGGDVPMDRGVCTDVLIRAFRSVGIDLQVDVHEDMARNFSMYPKLGKSKPDTNIDHRRVKNLSVFFTRMGLARPVTQLASDYLPGDIVMWSVGGLDHTGLVVNALVPGTDRHQVVHNIGDGAQMEDILFGFPIMGHFRYPSHSSGGA